VLSGGDCAEENIHWTALNSVILAEVVQAGGLYIIGGGDFFVEKRIEKPFSFSELSAIPDA